MKSDKVLKDFGEHIGIRNMIFDHKRSCSIVVANDNIIVINDVQDTALMINCIVGPVDKKNIADSKTTMKLLSMNMLFAAENGPYVGFEPTQNTVVLSVTTNLEEATPLVMESQISYLLKNKWLVRASLEESGCVLA